MHREHPRPSQRNKTSKEEHREDTHKHKHPPTTAQVSKPREHESSRHPQKGPLPLNAPRVCEDAVHRRDKSYGQRATCSVPYQDQDTGVEYLGDSVQEWP